MINDATASSATDLVAWHIGTILGADESQRSSFVFTARNLRQPELHFMMHAGIAQVAVDSDIVTKR